MSKIRRGDVYYIYRADTYGCEQRSGRPAIIVSNDLCNEHSRVVEVVYLTRQDKPTLPTHVEIEATGQTSTALCEQITSVDIGRLGDYKGHLTNEELEKVDRAVAISVGVSRQETSDRQGLALIALDYLKRYVAENGKITAVV